MTAITKFFFSLIHPQFSPAVTKALVTKRFTGDRRNELTGDICASIQVHS